MELEVCNRKVWETEAVDFDQAVVEYLVSSFGLDKLELVEWLYVPNAVFMELWHPKVRRNKGLVEQIEVLIETEDWGKGRPPWVEAGVYETKAKEVKRFVREVLRDKALREAVGEFEKAFNGEVGFEDEVRRALWILMGYNPRLKGRELLQIDEMEYRVSRGVVGSTLSVSKYTLFRVGKWIDRWKREFGGYPTLDGLFVLWLRGGQVTPAKLVSFLVFMDYWEALKEQRQLAIEVLRGGGGLQTLISKLKERGIRPPTVEVFKSQKELEGFIQSKEFQTALKQIGTAHISDVIQNKADKKARLSETRSYIEAIKWVDLLIPQNKYWYLEQTAGVFKVFGGTPAVGKSIIRMTDPIHSWARGELGTLFFNSVKLGRNLNQSLKVLQHIRMVIPSNTRYAYMVELIRQQNALGVVTDSLIRVKKPNSDLGHRFVLSAFSSNERYWELDWVKNYINGVIGRYTPATDFDGGGFPLHLIPKTNMEICFHPWVATPYKLTFQITDKNQAKIAKEMFKVFRLLIP